MNGHARMDQGITTELERLLSEPVSSVIEREGSALETLLEDADGRVVLFGCGRFGQQALACLRTIGVEPLGLSDNNPRLWGTQVHDVDVHPPAVAAERFGADALFLVTIWNAFHWYTETSQQLENLGCRRIAPPSPLYWRFPGTFLPLCAQDLPRHIYQHADDVLKGAGLWSDASSRQEYLQQVAWRARGAWTFRRRPGESYFLADVFDLISEEVFIDCGAFDGDTLRSYLSLRKGEFRRYVAIEPDEASLAELEAFVGALPLAIRHKIEVVRGAVGTGHASGRSESPSLAISDLPAAAMPITFIKMDIEGAELDALRGARAVIERDRPVLAICVYHTQHDLWSLPLFMKEMVPDHHMFLRSHEGDGWQTVAYAVPPERSTAGRQP